jgi:HK97 family phage major capsid protein
MPETGESFGAHHMSTVTAGFLDKLKDRRRDELAAAEAILVRCKNLGRERLNEDEDIALRAHTATVKALDASIRETKSELARTGSYALKGSGGQDAMTYGRQWAQRVAEKVKRAMGGGIEQRAVISGSIDIPNLVEPDVIPIARPQRLIDLFSNRLGLEGNAFEYYQQTVRTNNAAPVVDLATKPTSVFTLTAHTDRCRVIAHLSQPTPNRIWFDHEEVVQWLVSELVEGTLDALEHQALSGDGTGENMTGLLNTSGTTAVAFSTDVPTTLRKAVTALQVLGETPTGWALNPADAEAIDLTRWSTAGGFLSGGFEHDSGNGFGTSSNVFGADVRRVVSPSIPAGTAVLGDWSKLRLYIREGANVQFDTSGTNFATNAFVGRGQGRFGIGVLRPSAFAICDLTA